MRGGRTKYLLKRAMRGVLPDGILGRPKQGFAIPLGRWFGGRLEELVRDVLLSETARRRGIFDSAALEQRLRAPRADHGLGLDLWTLLSFELWCRAFLDARPIARSEAQLAPSAPQRQENAFAH
jgi:asparagine synthase (glutamine-hydrolysing)